MTDAGAGVAVPPGDAAGVADAMVRMARMPTADLTAMGVASRGTYDKRFSFAAALDQRADFIDRAAAHGLRVEL